METRDDVFSDEHLSALRRVRDAVAQLPGVRSAQSLVGATSFRYVAGRGLDRGEALHRGRSERTRPRSRSCASARWHDPLYLRTLVVARTAAPPALNVDFREMSDGEFIAADLDGQIGAILQSETHAGARAFHVSGRPHIKAVMYHGMLRDLPCWCRWPSPW